jgi:ribosomal protein L7/L12
MNKEQILEAIKSMTVLELSELVKALEEEFGVSAAAPAGAPTVLKKLSAADGLSAPHTAVLPTIRNTSQLMNAESGMVFIFSG